MYVCAINGYRLNSYGYFGTLCFSNESHGDEWEEWYVGQTEYNLKVGDSIQKIKKAFIWNISTYNDEIVVLPPDCTGLFSDMPALGVSAGSYMRFYAGVHEDRRRDVTRDFSNFDTSQVTCMKSMFENSFSIIHTYEYVNQGSSYYSVEHRTYCCNKLKIMGLESWNVSKVTDMTRMFAHISCLPATQHGPEAPLFSNIIGDVSPEDGKYKEFTAKEMFLGSSFILDGFTLILDHAIDANLEGMFQGFGCGYGGGAGVGPTNVSGNNGKSTVLDLTSWKFSEYAEADYIFKNMFRNTLCSKIRFPYIIPGKIKDADYMFAYDSSVKSFPYGLSCNDDETETGPVSVYTIGYTTSKVYYQSNTTLEAIQVRAGTDWENYFSSGYKMFLGQTLLNNFDSSDLGMTRANTRSGYGYFENLPPVKTTENYIKKLVSGNETWLESRVYFKTSEGWKESEVYV